MSGCKLDKPKYCRTKVGEQVSNGMFVIGFWSGSYIMWCPDCHNVMAFKSVGDSNLYNCNQHKKRSLKKQSDPDVQLNACKDSLGLTYPKFKAIRKHLSIIEREVHSSGAMAIKLTELEKIREHINK